MTSNRNVDSIPTTWSKAEAFIRQGVTPKMHHTRLTRVSALALMMIALAAIAFAQGSRGSITGKITDAQGAVVPAAPVIVRNISTGVTTKVITNQTGYYEAISLDPGTYSVAAEAPGFKTTVRPGIELETGARLSIDLRLEVGAASQSVEVIAESPLLDTTSAAGDCATSLHHHEPVCLAGDHPRCRLYRVAGHCARFR